MQNFELISCAGADELARACRQRVAAGILPAVEPWRPARRIKP